MADPQPGESTPAAGLPETSPDGPDPTRVERDGAEPTRDAADRTRVEGDGHATAPAPVRWSGSAAVPPPSEKKSWWAKRQGLAGDDYPADADDWATTPAVDPWADQDTPWDLVPPVPSHLPPTLTGPPVTIPPPPPTLIEPPAARAVPAAPPRPPQTARPQTAPAQTAPAQTAPAQTAPAQTAPPSAAPPALSPRRKGWRRKRPDPAPTAVPNRVAIAPRPTAPPRPMPPPPQAWRPPARPMAPPQRPLPPPRRRRRWPANLALFSLLSLVCCCGIPAYYAWPAARQYPVTATLPDSVADLNLRDDSASKRAVDQLTKDLRDANSSVDSVFAGLYRDGNGKRVTVFGTTGLRLTPGSDVKNELTRLTDKYDLRDVQSFDLGEAGAYERCGVGDTDGTSVVVCVWADHGSLATVLLTRRSVADSAELVGLLRSAALTRG